MIRSITLIATLLLFGGCSAIGYSRDCSFELRPGEQVTVEAAAARLGVALRNTGPGVVDVRLANGVTNLTRFAGGEGGQATFNEAISLDFINAGNTPVKMECMFTGSEGLRLNMKQSKGSLN